MILAKSHPSIEGIYQGSKWLKLQMLIDREEMDALFAALAPFSIFPITGIVNGEPITSSFFLEEYGRWIEGLKQGIAPDEVSLRRLLACVWTRNADDLYLQEVAEGKYLTKIRHPVLQVQAHFFTYSPLDHVFRPMSMGKESVFWGLQFSYPQIYQDPKTMELIELEEKGFYRLIQLWTREWTLPTPFFVDGKKTNSPIRLGKRCFSWVNAHPQLKYQKISIV